MIGNPAAPNLNALARQFGLATNYYGITHPSEPNYVAILGGSTFGVADDNPYYMNSVKQPSRISQQDAAGISWKAYLQSLPHAGYPAICYPFRCNGTPGADPLYVSKHDAIQNFTTSLNARDWSRQVPIDQLSSDPRRVHRHARRPALLPGLRQPGRSSESAPGRSWRRLPGSAREQDHERADVVQGNNAIAVFFDEGNDNAGCCDASTGGGRVASVIVTSHGPRAIQDANPYNHYSLLQTVQRSFGLGRLAFTCDTTNVKPLAPLFAVTGSAAIATKALPVPNLGVPTPTPTEPVTFTTKTPSQAGWRVQSSALYGGADNSLGGVAAASPNDIWVVGNYLPDAPGSNPDATLSLANHYDGTRWSVTPTPNAGPNFNSLFGVAARDGNAWAVGVHLNANFEVRGLIEAWDGSKWTIADNPQPGSQRDQLFAVSATSASDVWAVGDQVGASGKFESLVEHGNGTRWSVVPSPSPGRPGNQLWGVAAAAPNDVWAVGQQLGDSCPDKALIDHWDGSTWSVVSSPRQGSASAGLFSVAVSGGRAWAVGEADDPVTGAHPLVEQFQHGIWSTVDLPPAGSIFTSLFGVAVSDQTAWAVGTFMDPVSRNEETLTLRGGPQGWTVVNGPNPGSGNNILGGVVATSDSLWAVGHYSDGGGRLTLVERHQGN